MVPVDYHISTGLNAGNPCFKNEDQDQVHHLNSQEPESATFTSVYALADTWLEVIVAERWG